VNAPRAVVPMPHVQWTPERQYEHQALIAGDSLLVVNWQAGEWQAKFDEYVGAVGKSHELLASWLTSGTCAPPALWHPLWVHHYREHNARADSLANSVAKQHLVHLEWAQSGSMPRYLWVQFDGSFRGATAGACAVLHGTDVAHLSPADGWFANWDTLAQIAVPIMPVSATYSEMCAAILSLVLLRHALAGSLAQFPFSDGQPLKMELKTIVELLP